jgi:hypothetical protein
MASVIVQKKAEQLEQGDQLASVESPGSFLVGSVEKTGASVVVTLDGGQGAVSFGYGEFVSVVRPAS